MTNQLISILNLVVVTIFIWLNCIEPLGAQNFPIREKYRESIVFIQSERIRKDGTGAPEISKGTGFIFSKNGHVMTASHVILQSDNDTIVKNTGSIGSRHAHRLPLELVKRDTIDVAIVMLPFVQNLKPIEFGDSEFVPEDAPLYTLGFTEGLDLASAPGILSSRFGPKGNWQTTLPINPGNSGGPVFDMNGKVVGIAVGGFDQFQLVTYVIPAAYVTGIIGFARDLTLNTGPTEQGPDVIPEMTKISEEFEFFRAVDHEAEESPQELFCLPTGYKVTNVSHRITTINGDGTHIINLAPDLTNSSCVMLNAFIKGSGVVRIGPIIVDHRGRGWLGVTIEVQGEKGNQ